MTIIRAIDNQDHLRIVAIRELHASRRRQEDKQNEEMPHLINNGYREKKNPIIKR
jgi:hypothetical protein